MVYDDSVGIKLKICCFLLTACFLCGCSIFQGASEGMDRVEALRQCRTKQEAISVAGPPVAQYSSGGRDVLEWDVNSYRVRVEFYQGEQVQLTFSRPTR